MTDIKKLFENNVAWAEHMKEEQPSFFETLAKGQRPDYLWIGCSDSRVPANQIIGLLPGEVFVHRNVANVVVHSDMNMLSVLQFAVEVLKVKHVIVCGHYGCGGVQAALGTESLGLIDYWLRHIRDVKEKHEHQFEGLMLPEAIDRLCELNVIEQARNICRTGVVQEAWRKAQSLTVHAVIYGLQDGLLQHLDFSAGKSAEVDAAYQRAIARNAAV